MVDCIPLRRSATSLESLIRAVVALMQPYAREMQVDADHAHALEAFAGLLVPDRARDPPRLSDRSVLVTGGSGFLGRVVVDRLRGSGALEGHRASWTVVQTGPDWDRGTGGAQEAFVKVDGVDAIDRGPATVWLRR